MGLAATAAAPSAATAITAAAAGGGTWRRPSGCTLGTAPGTWVSDAPAGGKWQLLPVADSPCQLRNYIAAYKQAASGMQPTSTGPTGSSSSDSRDGSDSSDTTWSRDATSHSVEGAAHLGLQSPSPNPLHTAIGDAVKVEASSSSNTPWNTSNSSSGSVRAPPLRVLMLSDSVDRYILEHLCTELGGVKMTTALPQGPLSGGGEESGGTGQEDADTNSHQAVGGSDSTNSSASSSRGSGEDGSGARLLTGVLPAALEDRVQWMDDDPSWLVEDHLRRLRQLQALSKQVTSDSSSSSRVRAERAVLTTGNPAAAGVKFRRRGIRAAGPSPLGRTAYAFHSCVGAGPLKLASSYFPGVHPKGPFHRGVVQTAEQRLAANAALWARHSPGAGPQVVVVSSCLWDLARMARHEPEVVAGPELAPELLAAWAANFTRVVAAARATFPEARVWLTHTTLPPRHKAATGIMDKPYLGRAYYIHQLNAALAAVAAGPAQLALLDYAALGRRWAAGQAYLVDAIHPNQVVGLEAANLLLNVALAALDGTSSLESSSAGD